MRDNVRLRSTPEYNKNTKALRTTRSTKIQGGVFVGNMKRIYRPDSALNLQSEDMVVLFYTNIISRKTVPVVWVVSFLVPCS